VVLKRTGFGVSEVALSRLCDFEQPAGVQSDIPLPLHTHAAMLATGFDGDALRNMVPSVNEHLLQPCECSVSVLCNVRQYTNITKVRRQIMYDLIAKVIRISCANFHCNRLTAVQDTKHYESLIFGTHFM